MLEESKMTLDHATICYRLPETAESSKELSGKLRRAEQILRDSGITLQLRIHQTNLSYNVAMSGQEQNVHQALTEFVTHAGLPETAEGSEGLERFLAEHDRKLAPPVLRYAKRYVVPK